MVAAIVACSLSSGAQAQVNLSFSMVGNAGNAADTTGYGSVGYTYNIGTYDVTVSQYCTFLNDVAATDPYSLYFAIMASNANSASITQSGVSGSYSYSVIPGAGNNPITYVSWFGAARFTNWLSNGQPTGTEGNGTTETGAYTLSGTMIGVSVIKNASAQYWIPSENEWYKAAYYDPSLNGGAGGYWAYPTRSNTAPGASWANRTLANQANTWTGSPLTGSSNWLTPVGSFTNSASAYGTYDQGGDVWQWTDAVVVLSGQSYRAAQGGSWYNNTSFLQSSYGPNDGYQNPSAAFQYQGFRVATVPEPTVTVSLIVGMGLLAFRRKRQIETTSLILQIPDVSKDVGDFAFHG